MISGPPATTFDQSEAPASANFLFQRMDKIETAISICETKISSCEADISSCEAQIKRLLDLIEGCEESRREALEKELEYERTKASQLRGKESQLREEKIVWTKSMVHQEKNEVQFSMQGFCSACYWLKHRD